MAIKRLNAILDIDYSERTRISSYTPTEVFDISVNRFDFDNEAESCNVELQISGMYSKQLKAYINSGRTVLLELYIRDYCWSHNRYGNHRNHNIRDDIVGGYNTKKKYAKETSVSTDGGEEFERYSRQIQLLTPENQTLRFSIPYSDMNIGKHVFVNENWWETREYHYRFYLYFPDWDRSDPNEAGMPMFPDAITNEIIVSYEYGDDPVPEEEDEEGEE